MLSDSIDRAGRVGDFQCRFLSGSLGARIAWTSEKRPEGSVQETVSIKERWLLVIGATSDQPHIVKGEVYTSNLAQTSLICWVHSSSQVQGTISIILLKTPSRFRQSNNVRSNKEWPVS